MSLDVQMLRSSFDLVIARQPQLTQRFYAILFERYPQVRPLFRSNITSQAQMLQSALVAVLEHIEDPEWLKETLSDMGRKHVAYQVTDEMYTWVGASLLATLAEAAGSDWTAKLAQTWAAAYGAIAGLMQAAARDVRAA
jgi:hemoglobin-like flavoprotein